MVLWQAEARTICRKLDVNEPTFYRWKKRFGRLGVPEVRQPRQLREENRTLKQLVADLTLPDDLSGRHGGGEVGG